VNRVLIPPCMLLIRRTLPAELPPHEQQALAERLGEKVQRFEMWTDEAGHVTGLIFINHQALTKDVGEKPGITDADLADLARLPHLSTINFEAQPISDRGLAVLQGFSEMKQVGFHYMAKAEGAAASPDFITVIDPMRDLEILEIKHNFQMPAINVQKLTGPFPKVWRLVLDTPLTADQTMHLVRLCPNVTDLQLHRTRVSPEQLVEIARLLPKLEVLWLKVNGGLQAGHLQAMPEFQQLGIFRPQSFKAQVSYDDGWNALADIPRLRRLEIFGDPGDTNREAIKQLEQDNPRIVVDDKPTRSRNYNGL